MRTINRRLLWLGLLLAAPAFAENPDRWEIPVSVKTLENGLTVVVSPDASASDIWASTDSTRLADSLRLRPTSRNTASDRSIRVRVFSLIISPPGYSGQIGRLGFPSQYQALGTRA